jgi:Flp pilus assembly protein TadG
MHRHRTPHRDDRGVVAIELVLILPFLLMLIMGFLVLGNYLAVKGQASNLARDGARQAALFPGTPLGDARLSLDSEPCPTSPRDPAKSVTVKATLDVDLNSIPLIPAVLPSTLTQKVTMRCGG